MNKENPAEANAEMINPEMAAYYGNRPLMWRNLLLIMTLNTGWYVVFTVVNPLIQLRLNNLGAGEQILGWLTGINSWAYSYLVMYFAWRSDHTVTRFGRRIPYLFLSAPVIALTVFLFPAFDSVWLLIGMALIQMLFMDIKSAAIPLLNIDCMPRRMLARASVPGWIITAVIAFFALRYGMKLSHWSESTPYVVGGSVILLTTLVSGFLIKEPPVKCPTKEKFRPWSAMKVAWRDWRTAVLMCGVTMCQSLFVVYTWWIWLYAQNVLHFSRADTAQAVSWGLIFSIVASPPFAWLVDRVSPYKLIPLLIPVGGLVLWLLFNVTTVNGLIPVACLAISLQTIYSAADLMITRHVHPTETGSVTSTNSCLRGVYNGLLAIGTGFIIQKGGGSYALALGLGYALTCLAIGVLFFHRHLMRTKESAEPIREPEHSADIVESQAEHATP